MPLWTWAEMDKLVLHFYQGKVRGMLERGLFVCDPIGLCLYMWQGMRIN